MSWIDLMTGSFRSVVVITLASHARGPGFETQRKQLFIWMFDDVVLWETSWVSSRAVQRLVCHIWTGFELTVKWIESTAMLSKEQPLIPLGFEPRTSRVLGERDNHYTMESALMSIAVKPWIFLGWMEIIKIYLYLSWNHKTQNGIRNTSFYLYW